MMHRLQALTATTLLLVVLQWIDAPAEVRAPLTVAVLLTVTGLAIAPDAPWAVVIAISLSADTVITTALLAAGAYTPTAATMIIAGLGCAGIAARHRRHELQVTFCAPHHQP